jgi:hypothetical protein
VSAVRFFRFSHRGARLGIIFALVATLIGLHLTSAVATTTSSVGLLALRSGDQTAASGIGRYRYVILQDYMRAQIPAIRAANPDTKILVYKNVQATRSDGEVNYPSTGVTYTDANANHPDWFIKNSSGGRVSFTDYPNLMWAMDVSNPAYQTKWKDNVAAVLARDGWDGVFMDDVQMYNCHLAGISIPKYPDDAAIEADFRSFLATVGPALTASGYLVLPNIGVKSGNDYFRTHIPTFTQYTSGMMREFSTSWSSGALFGGVWWEWVRSINDDARAAGKIFVAVDYGSQTDVAHMRYSRASFLMSAGDNDALMYAPLSPATDPWNDEWTIDIGSPLGARFQTAGGWRRNFTGGITVVNPSETSSITMSLGGTYLMPNGSSVSSVALPAMSGLILRSTSPQPSPTPTASATPTPTASATPTPSPTPTASSSPSPSPTPTASSSPSPSPTPTPPAPVQDTVAPSAPPSLTGGWVSRRKVSLSWSASTDNVGVAGYRVYRDGALIGTTTSLTMTDRPSRFVTHLYEVRAYDAAGNVSGARSLSILG